MTDYLDPQEAARRLTLHKQTVVAWCRDGKLPGAVKLNGTRWRIPDTAIDAVLNPPKVRLAPRSSRSEARMKRGAV